MKPQLAAMQKISYTLGYTYPGRVQDLQDLSDWDNGIARICWSHCYYLQLALRSYESIATTVSVSAVNEWESTLGRYIMPYFWIIPNYKKEIYSPEQVDPPTHLTPPDTSFQVYTSGRYAMRTIRSRLTNRGSCSGEGPTRPATPITHLVKTSQNLLWYARRERPSFQHLVQSSLSLKDPNKCDLGCGSTNHDIMVVS